RLRRPGGPPDRRGRQLAGRALGRGDRPLRDRPAAAHLRPVAGPPARQGTMAAVSDIEFSKGHGTQNDFVVLPDPQVRLDLTPERVAALCDRQRGLGADGVLRVAKAAELVSAGVLDALPA